MGVTVRRTRHNDHRDADALAEDLRPILDSEIVTGKLVEGIELSAGTVVVRHGLGRVPRGYALARAEGAAPSYYETARDARTITLTAGGSATIALWVW